MLEQNIVTGEEIQKLILRWFNEYYPTWHEDTIEFGFEMYAHLPIEIKMIPAFYLLEHNIINGGWSQFLWNCFGSWREVIEIAKAGYKLTGGTSKQLIALEELYALCESNEVECDRAIAEEDGSLQSFSEFTKRSHMKSGNAWEMALWSGTQAYWQRLGWLEKNQSHIRTILESLVDFY